MKFLDNQSQLLCQSKETPKHVKYPNTGLKGRIHGGSDKEQELFPKKHDRMGKTLGFLALPQRVSKEGGHHDGDTVIDHMDCLWVLGTGQSL